MFPSRKVVESVQIQPQSFSEETQPRQASRVLTNGDRLKVNLEVNFGRGTGRHWSLLRVEGTLVFSTVLISDSV